MLDCSKSFWSFQQQKFICRLFHNPAQHLFLWLPKKTLREYELKFFAIKFLTMFDKVDKIQKKKSMKTTIVILNYKSSFKPWKLWLSLPTNQTPQTANLLMIDAKPFTRNSFKCKISQTTFNLFLFMTNIEQFTADKSTHQTW